jgi:hypothetical protein
MADKDEIQAATALFNEVINSDITALAERIDLGAPINFLGTCGEAPLHIAIYKRDDNMIRMLIDAGADIMFGNSNFDTALHIAARMGLPRVVEYLYEGASALNKKRLFLEAKNQDALTALQIACMPVRPWELDLTRLYRSWDHKRDPSLNDELFPLQHGRLECRAFLKEKMELDVRNKEKGSVADMVDQNYDFAKAAGILRGRDTSNFSARIFYSALDYPAKLDANVWNEDDKQFFLDYLPGVREVMTRYVSCYTIVLPSFSVCDVSVSVSVSLSLTHLLLPACLHSLTPPGTSLTVISPPSINHQSTQYSQYLLTTLDCTPQISWGKPPKVVSKAHLRFRDSTS